MAPGAAVDMAVRFTLHATEPVPCERTMLHSILRYAAVDPYAVAIMFPAGPSSEAVTWALDRDLVRAGLSAAAGIGDVRIWPAPEDGDTTYVELRAPAGQALLSASTTQLQAFLDATAAVVAFGAEADFVDIDAELEALLGRTC